MKRFVFAAALLFVPVSTTAQTDTVIQNIVDGHILPGFAALSARSQALAETAQADCAPSSPALRAVFGDAFDAWINVSHLRFGPTEVNDRAFALAFWPDSRGATPRALTTLIAQEDPIGTSAVAYTEMSIAARGFYALEFLLYDDDLMTAGDAGYHCQLVQTISADIATTADAIDADWQATYRSALLSPSADGVYRTQDEALQELFKALTTGLQFTSETRLGRPLGTFDNPRPTRAEARRSERSATHVRLSLTALQDLALGLAADDPEVTATLNKGFEISRTRLAALDDPTFAGVADPQTRFPIEVLQQSIDRIRDVVRISLGPTLGVAEGFNALDGD